MWECVGTADIDTVIPYSMSYSGKYYRKVAPVSAWAYSRRLQSLEGRVRCLLALFVCPQMTYKSSEDTQIKQADILLDLRGIANDDYKLMRWQERLYGSICQSNSCYTVWLCLCQQCPHILTFSCRSVCVTFDFRGPHKHKSFWITPHSRPIAYVLVIICRPDLFFISHSAGMQAAGRT